MGCYYSAKKNSEKFKTTETNLDIKIKPQKNGVKVDVTLLYTNLIYFSFSLEILVSLHLKQGTKFNTSRYNKKENKKINAKSLPLHLHAKDKHVQHNNNQASLMITIKKWMYKENNHNHQIHNHAQLIGFSQTEKKYTPLTSTWAEKKVAKVTMYCLFTWTGPISNGKWKSSYMICNNPVSHVNFVYIIHSNFPRIWTSPCSLQKYCNSNHYDGYGK